MKKYEAFIVDPDGKKDMIIKTNRVRKVYIAFANLCEQNFGKKFYGYIYVAKREADGTHLFFEVSRLKN